MLGGLIDYILLWFYIIHCWTAYCLFSSSMTNSGRNKNCWRWKTWKQSSNNFKKAPAFIICSIFTILFNINIIFRCFLLTLNPIFNLKSEMENYFNAEANMIAFRQQLNLTINLNSILYKFKSISFHPPTPSKNISCIRKRRTIIQVWCNWQEMSSHGVFFFLPVTMFLEETEKETLMPFQWFHYFLVSGRKGSSKIQGFPVQPFWGPTQ